ncbi:UNVERIFIED_CONTAM: RNA-binding protein CP33, chloroplastic [Sesamum calycinum]|uniref:RNA-binding protein CP33, chloroplastic n=1 Tax=Sesamum calycinum TaxID=2727403 RepID=A0AAW2LZT7_9LAMI
MALGTKEAAFSVFSSYPSTSPRLHCFNQSVSSVRFGISLSAPAALTKFTQYNLPFLSPSKPKSPGFQCHSSLESVTVEEEVEESGKPESRRKLFVLNLPWSFSVADIKKLFGECGTVADVEIIKQKDGKNRGFAFVTMSSGEEAQAAIEKYDSYELVGRIIRVQFAKRFKKPVRASPVVTPPGETRHKLYSCIDNPSGRSAGYGFVSFATKEEAESAISALDGKELLGRPIRLKFSEKNTDASESKEEESSEQQPENASENIYLFLFPSAFMTLLLNDNGQLILFYDTIRMLPCSRCCQHGVCHSMVMSTFVTRGWRPSFALPVMGRHNGFRAC